MHEIILSFVLLRVLYPNVIAALIAARAQGKCWRLVLASRVDSFARHNYSIPQGSKTTHCNSSTTPITDSNVIQSQEAGSKIRT